MKIGGLDSAPGFDWLTVRNSIRLEGDFANTSGLWAMQAVLPQGPWVAQILSGALPLIAGAYAVLLPHSTYVEVALDSKTSLVLKALWQFLGLDSGLFRSMVRQAVARGLGADMVGVRITTSLHTPGTEGKKAKTAYFPPDHADSRIMIGVEATYLLQAIRRGPMLRLSLGSPPGLPVTLEVPCPEAPGFALSAMRKLPEGTAVRFRQSGARPTTHDIVLGYVGAGTDLYQTGGHLPAGWLSDKLVNSVADKAYALLLLRGLFRSQVHASTMVPVGRLKKGGGDPAYLFVMFASVEGAVAFCEAIDKAALPPPLLEALSNFLDSATGRLVTFCAYIPPEAIAACPEKELSTLFKAGLTDTAAIKAAPANASV
jgi:hypothetical protein